MVVYQGLFVVFEWFGVMIWLIGGLYVDVDCLDMFDLFMEIQMVLLRLCQVVMLNVVCYVYVYYVLIWIVCFNFGYVFLRVSDDGVGMDLDVFVCDGVFGL